MVLVSAEAKKINRVFISFTAPEINCCKRVVFGLSASTITMFTVIYKCLLSIIYRGRLTDSSVVKVCPLFNNVLTMWILIIHVLGPGRFDATSCWKGHGFFLGGPTEKVLFKHQGNIIERKRVMSAKWTSKSKWIMYSGWKWRLDSQSKMTWPWLWYKEFVEFWIQGNVITPQNRVFYWHSSSFYIKE